MCGGFCGGTVGKLFATTPASLLGADLNNGCSAFSSAP